MTSKESSADFSTVVTTPAGGGGDRGCVCTGLRAPILEEL